MGAWAGGGAGGFDMGGDPMSYDDFETDVSGEVQEARELDFQHDCELRDIEQGITPLDAEEGEE